jgi:uridine kinase
MIEKRLSRRRAGADSLVPKVRLFGFSHVGPTKAWTPKRVRGKSDVVIRKKPKPVLVAIVGGSGSGKTWLAQKLEQALAPSAARLCLDDFYLDRSRLSPARRARLNFDHPRAIDWLSLDRVLKRALSGRVSRVPCYDFKTHCRLEREKALAPKAMILVEGLWLLLRPAIRRLFSLSIFLECPTSTRLRRRIDRDRVSRGRARFSIERQFRKSVQPMHERYVAPQAWSADLVFKGDCNSGQVRDLVKHLKGFLPGSRKNNTDELGAVKTPKHPH